MTRNQDGSRSTIKLCSAKVANKTLKKGGSLFLCSVRRQSEEPGHQGCMEVQFAAMLQEFQDVLSTELPRTLLPKRVIDHC